MLATGTRNIGAIRGLIRISPPAAGALAIGAPGIAGAPPFALFLSEASVLRAGIRNGHYLVVGLLTLFIATAFFGILYQVNRILFGNAEIAPGNVSAILSGVILNLGIYGIVRVNADLLPIHSLGAGAVILIVGALSALTGILYATIRNDLKEMLAYSSIENMSRSGIYLKGRGSAATGRDRLHSRILPHAQSLALQSPPFSRRRRC